jgi:CubicO group peptidase (beta-lactamase class C family)
MKLNPDAAGMDGRRLERVTEHLQQRYIDAGRIAGCQVAVMRHGETAYFASFGMADRERGRPVEDDTIWRIYSMTKPITGVALMSLYERGHFQLDDPVHRFIPEWRDLKVSEPDRSAPRGSGGRRLVEPQRPMSVRDVMMHMSGLGYSAMRRRGAGSLPSAERPAPMAEELGNAEGAASLADFGAAMDAPWTLETMTSYLAERPLRFHPGTQWLYSVSTDVCARLVEIMSGKRFDEYLRQEIFDPLGMDDTGFTVPDGKVDRFSANYARNAGKELVLVEDPEHSGYRRERSFLSGGGGLVSTAPDYARFAQMLCNGGELDGTRILGPKTVELMSVNHLPGGGELREFAAPGAYGEVGFDGMGFGLTMAVGLGPARTGVIGSAGEYMWGGAASTIFWVDPAESLVVVFMTQLMPSGTFNFRGQLKALVYPAIVS